MIATTRRLFVLDHYRVPYSVVEADRAPGTHRLTSDRQDARSLIWFESTEPSTTLSFSGIPFLGSAAPESALTSILSGRSWTRGAEIQTLRGEPVSSVLHADDGTVVLPFDPDQLVWGTLAERYVDMLSGRSRERLRRAYYAVRGALPRPVQIAIRRRYARMQERQAFPDWPVEPRLHEFLEWLLDCVHAVVGEQVPSLAPWPDGAKWAVVLTHDVEHQAGYDFIDQVLAVEREAGLRSAWYFVPERDYRVSDERVQSLVEGGWEVGLHGLRHDGRDLDDNTFAKRLPAMREHAARWGATGFRSPSTLRSWNKMARLGLDYDSSYSDTARYEPIAGGSCLWLPFFIDELVELPITMPMDHTLFELLGELDESAWLEKAVFLREAGGMALLLTHPDYLTEPPRLASYERFLERVRSDPTAWIALPREVSNWWRARAASVPVLDGGKWAVDGEAAGRARVVMPSDLPSA